MGQNDLNFFDRRIANSCVEKGLITKDQLKKHIESLPDEAENADYVTLDMEDSEISQALTEPQE